MQHPQIIEFDQQVELLLGAFREQKHTIRQLEQELEIARAEVRRVHAVEDELRKKNRALEIANGISGTEQDKDVAKQRIDYMIKDIDKCLAILEMM